MSEELYGLDEEQVQRLARMLADYESGRLFTPPFLRPEVLPPLQWTQLGKASSAITAASGSIVGTGSVKLWRLETDYSHYTEQDLGATDDVTVFNPTTTAINSGDYVELFRDPYSGQWWAQPFGGGGAVAATFSGCRTYRSSSQSINNATPTFVLWNAERYDTDGYHDLVSNTDRFAATVGKYYLFGASVTFDANATGGRGVSLYHSSGHYVASSWIVAGTAGVNHTLCVVGEYLASSASPNYFAVEVYQNSGAALNVLGGDESNNVTCSAWIELRG